MSVPVPSRVIAASVRPWLRITGDQRSLSVRIRPRSMEIWAALAVAAITELAS